MVLATFSSQSGRGLVDLPYDELPTQGTPVPQVGSSPFHLFFISGNLYLLFSLGVAGGF
jgi:hypothetical protein